MAEYQQKDFHTVTPYIYGRLDLIDFLKRVFGAELRHQGSDPDNFHGEVKIGDSIVMLGIGKSIPPAFGPPSQWGKQDSKAPPPATVYVYVKDTDAAYATALQAGATSLGEPADQSWGDRMAGVRDSYGNCWWMATYKGSK